MTRLLTYALLAYSLLMTAYAISVTVLYHQMFRMDKVAHVAVGLDSLRQEMDKKKAMQTMDVRWFELLEEE